MAKMNPMFRFTIRDVVWLTVAVGLACKWWIEHEDGTQWRKRAEILAGQIEAEADFRVLFPKRGVLMDHANGGVFIPTDRK